MLSALRISFSQIEIIQKQVGSWFIRMLPTVQPNIIAHNKYVREGDPYKLIHKGNTQIEITI